MISDIMKKALLITEEREEKSLNLFLEGIARPEDSYFVKVENSKNEVVKWEAKRLSRRKAIAIAIIAAIMLTLTACVIYREEIKGFFVEVFDKSLKLSSTDDANSLEIKEYAPAYMPKDYYLTNESYYSDRIQKSWSNGNSKIILRQTIKNSNTLTVDTEDDSYIFRTLDDLQLHCVQRNSIYVITWCMDDYVFTLRCPDELSWEEIEAIIAGIEPM